MEDLLGESDRIDIEVWGDEFTTAISIQNPNDRDALLETLNLAFRRKFGEPFIDIAETDNDADTDSENIQDLQQTVHELGESVSRVADRVAQIEDRIEELDADDSEDELEEKFEDAIERFQDKLDQVEDRIDDIEISDEAETEVVDNGSDEDTVGQDTGETELEADDTAADEQTKQSQDSSTEDDTDTDIECPQCGNPQESIRSLSPHTSRSQDHDDISSFFRNQDNKLECPICGTETDDSAVFSTHFQEEHGTSMVRYYVEHYDDLGDFVDTGKEEEESEDAAEQEQEEVRDTEQADEHEEEQTKECSNCGYANPLDRFKENDDCPECGEALEEREFDRLPELLEDQVIEPDLPYTYSEFKSLDRIEQAAAVYYAGKQIRKGDVADYADTVLKTEVSSTSDTEAQYVYRIITQDLDQYFEQETEESMYGRDKTVYILEDALPSGVEELDLQGWTVDEFNELSEAAKSEIVLRTLDEIQPASKDDVQDHIYQDGEEPNGQIQRLLTNYLVKFLQHTRRNGEKLYRLNDEIRERLQKDGLSLHQAQQKRVSGRTQLICQDCSDNDGVYDSTAEAKKHRRKTGHVNWEKKNHLPWRSNSESDKVTA